MPPQDNLEIRPGQPGVGKGRPCLTNLLSSYDKVICLVGEGKAVDVTYREFSKAFGTVSHKPCPRETGCSRLGGAHRSLGGTLADGRARGGVGNVTSSWAGHQGCPQGSVLAPALFNTFIKNLGGGIGGPQSVCR